MKLKTPMKIEEVKNGSIVLATLYKYGSTDIPKISRRIMKAYVCANDIALEMAFELLGVSFDSILDSLLREELYTYATPSIF